MQLEVGSSLIQPVAGLTTVADATQLLAECSAICIAGTIRLVHREPPAHNAAGQHSRGETRALLVRPTHDLYRITCTDARIIERTNYLQRAEDTQDAIESAACWHRVEVGP